MKWTGRQPHPPGSRRDANIILGATFDESLAGVIRVSVVATRHRQTGGGRVRRCGSPDRRSHRAPARSRPPPVHRRRAFGRPAPVPASPPVAHARRRSPPTSRHAGSRPGRLRSAAGSGPGPARPVHLAELPQQPAAYYPPHQPAAPASEPQVARALRAAGRRAADPSQRMPNIEDLPLPIRTSFAPIVRASSSRRPATPSSSAGARCWNASPRSPRAARKPPRPRRANRRRRCRARAGGAAAGASRWQPAAMRNTPSARSSSAPPVRSTTTAARRPPVRPRKSNWKFRPSCVASRCENTRRRTHSAPSFPWRLVLDHRFSGPLQASRLSLTFVHNP